MDIHRIILVRAKMAATVEYLQGLPPSITDREEREAHADALRAAQEAYAHAEALFAQATCTLTSEEIEALERRPAA